MTPKPAKKNRIVSHRAAHIWVWEGTPGQGEPHNFESAFSRGDRNDFAKEVRAAQVRCIRNRRAIAKIELDTHYTNGDRDRVNVKPDADRNDFPSKSAMADKLAEWAGLEGWSAQMFAADLCDAPDRVVFEIYVMAQDPFA